MSIDVDLGVLSTIVTDLESGAEGLEGLAGSVPAKVDAGPMTAVVASMLSQIVDSAGNVSTSMSGAADQVRESRRYYERSDASSETSLKGIGEVMNS